MSPKARPYKWEDEDIYKEALKFNHRTEFKQKSPLLYNAAVQRGLLNKVCSHMTVPKSKRLIWTFDKCKEICEKAKGKSRSEIKICHPRMYNALIKNKWIDTILPIPTEFMKHKRWTYEEAKEEAKKFSSKVQFKKYKSGAYQASTKNKWINNFF